MTASLLSPACITHRGGESIPTSLIIVSLIGSSSVTQMLKPRSVEEDEEVEVEDEEEVEQEHREDGWMLCRSAE